MTKNYYEYKGYYGSAEIDIESGDCHGRLLFIVDVIAYSAESGKELESAFHEAVDEYLEDCEELGKKPDLPCKGSFNVRVTPELHRDAAIYARANAMSLNSVVAKALQQLVHSEGRTEHVYNLIFNQETEQPRSVFATASQVIQETSSVRLQ